MEAYFGKDNARSAQSTLDSDCSVFGYNESLKRKYPVDKYQKLPGIEAKRRLMQERSDITPFGIDSKDDMIQKLIEGLDFDNTATQVDKTHPTDKNRSYLKDAEQAVENYLKRKEKASGIAMWNTRELNLIRQKLKDEYFPKPKEVVAAATPAPAGEDAKQEDKFEPFYEGESAAASESASQTDSSAVETSSS